MKESLIIFKSKIQKKNFDSRNIYLYDIKHVKSSLISLGLIFVLYT